MYQYYNNMQRKRQPSLEARRVARKDTSVFAVAALCLFLSCFLVFSVHPYMYIDIVHIVLSEYCSCPVFGHFFVPSTGYQGTPQKAHRRMFVNGRPFFCAGRPLFARQKVPPQKLLVLERQACLYTYTTSTEYSYIKINRIGLIMIERIKSILI